MFSFFIATKMLFIKATGRAHKYKFWVAHFKLFLKNSIENRKHAAAETFIINIQTLENIIFGFVDACRSLNAILKKNVVHYFK